MNSVRRDAGRRAGERRASLAHGTPVTRGEQFLGLQMSLSLPEKRPTGRPPQLPVAPAKAKARATAKAKATELAHLLCPRCGRYLAAALPGASALCPRCGVWAANR